MAVQYIACAAIVVSSIALVYMSVELWRLRTLLEFKGLQVLRFGSPSMLVSGVTASHAGYAIYVWRQGRWVLDADLSKPGFEPASPTIEGSYEGQAIKKESAPRSGA